MVCDVVWEEIENGLPTWRITKKFPLLVQVETLISFKMSGKTQDKPCLIYKLNMLLNCHIRTKEYQNWINRSCRVILRFEFI
jgi:hypothetical protein